MDNIHILKFSLFSGALYFLCISVAHIAGLKIPGLFIYYDVTSYQYQDNIISFLAFGWSAFFYAGSKHIEIIKPILFSCVGALAGLVNITQSTNFGEINLVTTSTTPYWIQIALLFIYVSWLWLFAIKGDLIFTKDENA